MDKIEFRDFIPVAPGDLTAEAVELKAYAVLKSHGNVLLPVYPQLVSKKYRLSAVTTQNRPMWSGGPRIPDRLRFDWPGNPGPDIR